jgi:ribosomal protein S18 acetylase RimI-like enzyme
MPPLAYHHDRPLSVEVFADVLRRSTLGERRPVDDPHRLGQMLRHANLLCTAWAGDQVVGVARGLTDFSYCCYLSDLAVDVTYQGRGVGTELIRLMQSRLEPGAKIILLSAPKARSYYPHLGFEAHPSAWTVPARPLLAPRGRTPETAPPAN